ncbi:putative transcription factor MYB family [Lupinus albus]|uniref:Putative transcription factor MYB family n=1 Tax=Lupinus albus TaxID=3870 RepID=A0A6A4NNX8_LUPAL|nr:putative transcription factor MYB family [Lupinus albus]
MQLGDPTVLETYSGEAVAENEGVNGVSEEKGIIIITNDSVDGHGDESYEKMNGGGNRWPRQETIALLKIRSDMDAVFRDSSLKGPLWEDVSRKLADLGYHRSAKKCKEKFENVFKYHKRTKESRSGKSEGKTYRFFDQLQALEKQLSVSSYPPKPQPQPTLSTTNNNISSDTVASIPLISTTTFPSTNPTIISPPPLPPSQTNITCTTKTVVTNPNNDNNNNTVSYSLPNITNLFINASSTSSTASDEDLEEKYRKKRKRKDYFLRLTRQVLAKQEEMQKKFLEMIDTREKEYVTKQDAWRMEQMARITRERELLAQERTTAAAKDAAIVKFLQKLSGGHNLTTQLVDQTTSAKITQTSSLSLSPLPSLPPVSQVLQPQPQPQPQQKHMNQLPLMVINNNVEIQKMNHGNSSGGRPLNSSSRWPKAEVQALIRLRTSLDAKYQENAPKAPLWEDISAWMQRLGYTRNAKRCKEKWENINKYFKKVKESNKKRREDSKTCPYFEELEALYQEKSKNQNPFGVVASGFNNMKPNEMMEPLMVQPEQQWRPPTENELTENNGDKKRVREDAEKGDSMEDDKDDGEEDGDSMEKDEEGDNGYEITTNKLPSVDTVE